MTAPQLMRAVLVALADPATFARGLFMARGPAGDSDLPPPPSAASFRSNFDVVFVDSSGWLNLAANMSSSGLKQVHIRLQAGSAISLVSGTCTPFALNLFLPKVRRSACLSALAATCLQAQQAAQRTVKLLDMLNASEDAFDAAFLVRCFKRTCSAFGSHAHFISLLTGQRFQQMAVWKRRHTTNCRMLLTTCCE